MEDIKMKNFDLKKMVEYYNDFGEVHYKVLREGGCYYGFFWKDKYRKYESVFYDFDFFNLLRSVHNRIKWLKTII